METSKIETQVRQAIGVHQALHLLFSNQGTQLAQMDSKDILSLSARMDELLTAARQTDDRAFDILQNSAPTTENRQLVEEMLQALRRTAEQSDLLKARIRSMMAVVQADLSELRTGKKVLVGYGFGSRQRGGTLHGAG